MARRKIKPTDPQDFVEIDRVIHEPARLVIMLHLAAVENADYVFLQTQTGMSWGNLSAHLRKLADVGYVTITKEFIENRPHSMASATEKGRRALQTYIEQFRDIIGDYDLTSE